VQTALARTALDLQDARITVNFGSLPSVFANAAQLAGLFEILLRHATMHLPGGTVRVGVAQLPENWMFIVSFVPSTENRVEDAGIVSGLALAVCERIIHTHNGSYSIARSRDGWEFRFRIPRGKAAFAAR
jgi:light-regulated signal transduction histidine kinase (bacteriophytochrome)